MIGRMLGTKATSCCRFFFKIPLAFSLSEKRGTIQRLLQLGLASRHTVFSSVLDHEDPEPVVLCPFPPRLQVVVLGLCILSAYLIKRNRFYYLPESAASILVGVVVGGMAKIFYPTKDELDFLSFNSVRYIMERLLVCSNRRSAYLS